MDNMKPTHRPIADLTSWELLHRAIKYRRMAGTARGPTIASALERLAIRYALLAARREVEEASHPRSSVAIQQDQSELAKLIGLAEQSAANEPDPVRALVNAIRTVAEGSADPLWCMDTLSGGARCALRSHDIGVRRRRAKKVP